METSNYYDFSSNPVEEWKEQAKKYDDVQYSYNDKQECWCRKINNVLGELIEVDNPKPNTGSMGGYFKYEFVPKHPLVTYPQCFVSKEDFYNKRKEA